MSICDASSIVAQKVASVKQPKEQVETADTEPRRPDAPKEPASEIRQNGLLVPRCTSAIEPKCTRSSIIHRIRKEQHGALQLAHVFRILKRVTLEEHRLLQSTSETCLLNYRFIASYRKSQNRKINCCYLDEQLIHYINSE